MSKSLEKLDPGRVFRFFEEICNIPHGSRNCKALSDYCVAFAESHGLTYTQDELGNIIIIKEASVGREDDATVMLQGHLDMVCQKKATSHHDFDVDELNLVVKDDFVSAKGTTLGGDDGIGVALILAFLDDEKLSHPRLECIFTVDEEIGMIGAEAIDLEGMKAKYLINLDSEDDNIIWAGCAGGLTAKCKLPITKESFKGVKVKIIVSGLKGGHSGAEIDQERGNANTIMGRVLHNLNGVCLFSIIDIKGGEFDNVITSKCVAKISLDINDQYFIDENIVGIAPDEYKQKKIKEVQARVKEISNILVEEYKNSDPDVGVSFEIMRETTTKCIDILDTEKIIFFLMNAPQGVMHMSKKMENLVETSSNVGIVKIGEQEAEFTLSIRSSVNSRKQEELTKVRYLSEFLGGQCDVEGEYPGWDIKKSSQLRKTMSKVYKDMYGVKPEVRAIHAGLEVGYFLEKMPWLDAVSMGPNVFDIHSYDERLSISSTKKMYKYLQKVLATIK